MAAEEVTITLEEARLNEIRALVAHGAAASVSGFVKNAVSVALSDAAGLGDMLKQALDETGGPLTKEERAWADSILSPRVAEEAVPKAKGRMSGIALNAGGLIAID